jgi:hypothetical protein
MSNDKIVNFPKQEPGPAQRGIVDAIMEGVPITLSDGNAVKITAEGLGFSDMEAAINMRLWLQHACEAKGAEVVGSGYGFGAGDLDLIIEGHRYNVSIRPQS